VSLFEFPITLAEPGFVVHFHSCSDLSGSWGAGRLKETTTKVTWGEEGKASKHYRWVFLLPNLIHSKGRKVFLKSNLKTAYIFNKILHKQGPEAMWFGCPVIWVRTLRVRGRDVITLS
jgi:hypothetical protein